MRIVVVSQYFRPEVGATQNRLGAFVDGLVARGHAVDVVCEQPNHPEGVFHPGYGRRPLVRSREDGAGVQRLWVKTAAEKTTTTRLAFYASFGAGAALAVALRRRPDVVFCSSPPLPGAATACLAAWARRIPFVLDVRDLWPAAAEALGELSNRRLIAAFERLERWLYVHATRVTATTEPFCRHIDALAGPGTAVHVPNGALDELLDIAHPPPLPGRPFTVGYAGNLGIAQGLGIVPDAAQALRDEADGARFVLVGGGPVKAQLEQEVAERGLGDRVEFRPAVPTHEVGAFLAGCDALLVPLRAHELLRDFIPSKLYDGLAVGRPLLVAAAGEPHAAIERHGGGIAVPPEDGAALAAAIRRLAGDRGEAERLGREGRLAARELVRSRQVDRLERVLVEAGR